MMNYSNHDVLDNLFISYSASVKFSFYRIYVDLSIIKEITATFVVVISFL